jgi:hypothetical protein
MAVFIWNGEINKKDMKEKRRKMKEENKNKSKEEREMGE